MNNLIKAMIIKIPIGKKMFTVYLNKFNLNFFIYATIFLFLVLSRQYSSAQNPLQTVMVGDTVVLKVSGTVGFVQWQCSEDSINWVDIPNSYDTLLRIIASNTSTGRIYYRAEEYTNQCKFYYSNIIRHRLIFNTNEIQVGDDYHGGIVFYKDTNNQGLIAPKVDQAFIVWGCYGTSFTWTNNAGNGLSNTNYLAAYCWDSPTAATVCYNLELEGYNDWFLPAINELTAFCQKKNLFSNLSYYYWSSTNINSIQAYRIALWNCAPQESGKADPINVRCIRSFSNNSNISYSNTLINYNQYLLGGFVSIINQSTQQTICTGESTLLNINVIGGGPYFFQWKKDGQNIIGANDSVLIISNASINDNGIYNCIINNNCDTIESDNIQLNIIELSIDIIPIDNICSGQNFQINTVNNSNFPILSYPYTYTWSPINGLSDASISNPISNIDSTTSYFVTITDNKGCTSINDVSVFIQNPYPNEQICIVTIDTITWKNKVIWEKTIGVGSENYLIYKETGLNSYSQIGNVLASQPSEYIDMASVPESQGYKYKISVIDTCGNESIRSYYHKTVNLTIASYGNTIGLNWNHYVDESGLFTPLRYYIYRGISPNNMALYDSIPGSFTSYNDVNVFSVYYYMIGVKKLGGCNTTKSDFISFSNKKDNGMLLGLANQTGGTIAVSPNPFTESTTITIPNLQISNNNSELNILDVTGKVIRKINVTTNKIEIKREDLPAGVYFIELQNDKIYRGKLIVE